jgi:lysophospholipid acyltransferase (LPLAT)-like uncharacterized protein
MRPRPRPGLAQVKQWWRDRRPYILSGLIYLFARTIGRSLRLKVIGWEQVQELKCGKIVCGWHGRSIIPANFFKGMGVWAIISHSRDGEMQTRIFRRFGFQIIRGSTGRGGVRAAIEAIRVLKQGDTMAITPDGPRGPSGEVQGGVMLMARKSGAALIPVGSSARPAWYAPTWDRYLVPWLFAKAVFVFGDPMYLKEDASEEEVETLRVQFEQEIHRMQAEADRLVGAKPPPPKR